MAPTTVLDLDPGHPPFGTQRFHAGVEPSEQQTRGAPTPKKAPSAARPLDPGQDVTDTQMEGAGVEPSEQQTSRGATPKERPSAAQPFDPGQARLDTHEGDAGVEPPEQQTTARSIPIEAASAAQPFSPGHPRADAQQLTAGAEFPPAETSERSTPTTRSSRLGDVAPSDDPTGVLVILADALDDLQAVRIATENRVRALLQGKGAPVPENAKTDVDILVDGALDGMPKGSYRKAVEQLWAIVLGARADEHKAVVALEGAMRAHPLGPWVGAQIGVGAKQAARLIGAIGDPYWHPAGRARTPGELWALCGLHVVDGAAPRRQKGQKANWNTKAKIAALNVVRSCMKQNGEPDKNGKPRSLSPYRAIYDERRVWTAERVHDRPCMNRSRYSPDGCGIRQHPEWGEIGSPWRPGHQQADAVRYAAKRFLLDLWHESKRLHEGIEP